MKPTIQKTYDHILETALKLFKEKGYKETSIQDIYDAAETGRSTFYKYFSCKEEIAYDLYTVDRIFSSENMVWVLSAKTPLEKLIRMHLCFLRFPTKETGPAIYQAQCKYMANNPSKNIFEAKRYSIEAFVVLAKQAKELGEIAFDGDLEEMIAVFMNYQYGLETSWSFTDHNFDYVSAFALGLRLIYHIPENIPIEQYIKDGINI